MRVTRILRSKTVLNLTKVRELYLANTPAKCRALVKFKDNRTNVLGDELCQSIFSKFGNQLNEHKGGQIIDMYPGTCFFASYLNKAIKPSKHILLEPNKLYEPFIKEAIQEAGTKSNMEHLDLDGYDWSTWHNLFEDKVIDAPVVPYEEGVNKSILFTAHLPSGLVGERLLSQYLTTIPEKSWLMRFGRVRMLIWMPDSLRKKIAPRLFPNRYKIAALTETVVDLQEFVAPVYEFPNMKIMENYKKVLKRIELKKEAAAAGGEIPPPLELVEQIEAGKPAVEKRGRKKVPGGASKKLKTTGGVELQVPEDILGIYRTDIDFIVPSTADFFPATEPYALLCLTPRLIPEYILPTEGHRDRWRIYDYTLKKLFALKNQPVLKAIKSMGPAVETLLEKNEELKAMPDLKDRPVNNLTLEEIGAIAKAYYNWDFRLSGGEVSEDWILWEDNDIAKQKARKARQRATV